MTVPSGRDNPTADGRAFADIPPCRAGRIVGGVHAPCASAGGEDIILWEEP